MEGEEAADAGEAGAGGGGEEAKSAEHAETSPEAVEQSASPEDTKDEVRVRVTEPDAEGQATEPAHEPEAPAAQEDAKPTRQGSKGVQLHEPEAEAEVPTPGATTPMHEGVEELVEHEAEERGLEHTSLTDQKKTSSIMKTVQKGSSLIYKTDLSALGMESGLAKEDSAQAMIKKGLGSKGKLALGSVISIRRASLTGDGYDKGKVPRYANTYRMESENPFNPEKVEKILEAVVVEALENLTYDPEKCAKQAKWASSAIRAQVKDLKFDRYKLICLMTIGEKNSQDVLATCRFLWDIEKDRYAVYAHENTYVYGYAQCFGLYYE